MTPIDRKPGTCPRCGQPFAAAFKHNNCGECLARKLAMLCKTFLVFQCSENGEVDDIWDWRGAEDEEAVGTTSFPSALVVVQYIYEFHPSPRFIVEETPRDVNDPDSWPEYDDESLAKAIEIHPTPEPRVSKTDRGDAL